MHNKKQKVKIRRSGDSVRRKVLILGKKCNIFSIVMYWNPTHRRMETAVHIPPGQKLPDLNKIALRAMQDKSQQSDGRRTPCSTDPHQSTGRANGSQTANHRAPPLSVYDFPDDDADTTNTQSQLQHLQLLESDTLEADDTASDGHWDNRPRNSSSSNVAEVCLGSSPYDDLQCYHDGRTVRAPQQDKPRNGTPWSALDRMRELRGTPSKTGTSLPSAGRIGKRPPAYASRLATAHGGIHHPRLTKRTVAQRMLHILRDLSGTLGSATKR
ncbi:hypothetical protein BKA67DRAFT_541873 [Truncatella angustata]|uniref:Uncharacterized protein n=1 Tax=Truncatella angustata TaxID=152316 RepID=A0A9P8U8Y9_9PEZI|nr:uncharacterized protein BKA67DRAFT_541873 [Truncatella angustata]KAH6645709.1 hypothetical protein BKA67DRAFT_541873 [Truncatella angustata]